MRKIYKWFVGLAIMITFMACSAISVSAEEENVKATMITARFSGSMNLGATIDKSRFTIVAYYTNETSRILDPDEFDIFPTTIQEIGNNAINVSYTYNAEKVSINATVYGRTPSTLTKIEAAYKGNVVVAGDSVNRGDVRVTAYYGDGTSAEVDTWHFANYIITGGTNVVYVVYTEDGYTRNCPIRIEGISLAEKQLIKITAEYTGDDVDAGEDVDIKDIQVSAYFKYISTTNTVTTSMEGVSNWTLDKHTMYPGTNLITIYYEYGGVMATTTIEVEGLDYEGNWVTYDGFFRFQNNDGTYKTNEWYTENEEMYHFNDAGNMDIGWRDIDDKTYYFDEQGRMCTGWENIRNIWYYFEKQGNNAGALVTEDWVKDGLYWYYMNEEGKMVTNEWVEDEKRWYYLSGNGIMATGWFYYDDDWFFLTNTGAMATGWYQTGGKWYYANEKGRMQANTWIDKYYVDSTGAWTDTRG